MDELFCRQLQEISVSVANVLMGHFNFSDRDWEHLTASTNKSGKFLNHVKDDFLSQAQSEPNRKVSS